MGTLVKILVVEDEMLIGAKISLLLTNLGYEVTGILPRGEEALLHIKDNKPDIILLDINLKGDIDVIETAKRLQEISDTAIIYLTANADEATFNRAKTTSPQAFISKPFKQLDLQRAIELTISRMAINENNSDELLRNAFTQQQQALQLEPYAAYIQNELGNLYMHKKNFDSALYYFNYASALAPTWAIPYSNKIRLFFALQKPQDAYRVAQIADSLQPNLSFVNVNVGLVMEKDSNWLAAESYYLKAISENKIHYLPYERLGYVYINTGDYAKAEKYFIEADLRKNSFAVNDNVFDFGVEAGGSVTLYPPPDEKEICYSLDEKTVKGWENYIALSMVLPKIIDSNKMDADQMNTLKGLFERAPQLPFNAHYLGKEYFKFNNFSKAEKLLKQAIQNQIPDNELLPALILQLKKSIQENWSNGKVDSFIKNSCLLNNLQIFEYDNLEDYYMLANIYEQNKNLPSAITIYKKS